MPLIRYKDASEQEVEIPREGMSLLEISLSAKLAHYHQCGGTARCTTCRVRVLDGAENLSPRSGPEAQIAIEKTWSEDIRLACQARAHGSATIARIVLEDLVARALYPDAPPEHPAEERSLAIMFCDLRNFTAFAASHLPHDVVYVVNRFFREVCDPVLGNDGYIDKYLGDGFLAVFGLNKSDPAAYCLDALRAAVRIPGKIRTLNRWLREAFQAEFDFGIGLHFGTTVVGHTGHPLKMQLTVLGDTVNIASRIESMNKEIGSHILASSDFITQVQPHLATTRSHRRRITRTERWDVLHEIETENVRDEPLLIQTSYDLIQPQAEAFARRFYEHLFAIEPRLRQLFEKSDMTTQLRMFMEMVWQAVLHIHRPAEISHMLRDLGTRHAIYGVRGHDYALGEQALIKALTDQLGSQFRPEVEAAWRSTYARIALLMLDGAPGGKN